MNRRLFLQNASSALTLAGIPSVNQGLALGTGASDMEQQTLDKSARLEASSIRIGNFNASMPGGIAFIKDNQWGIVIDVGWDPTGRPGIAAPDYSINHVEFQHDSANVKFDWGVVSPEAVAARIKAEKPIKLKINLPSRPWSFFNNVFMQKDDYSVQALAFSPSGTQALWELKCDSVIGSDLEKPSSGGFLIVSLQPGTSLRFTAGFGTLPDLALVDGLLDEASERYEKTRARVSGSWGDFAGAIADNINNSQLYSSLNKTVATVIGRDQWIVTNPDYLPYFTWDTSFNALLSSLESPYHARQTFRTLLSYQLPDGMMPQFGGWNHDPLPYANIRHSNPPVTSMCVWKVHERWPDQEFLSEVYPSLLRWHDWWPKHSDGNGNGLLEWGAIGDFGDARLACGWDDTPAFNGATKIGNQMNADAVDLNSLWSMDAEYLSKMAEVLGKHEDASRLRAENKAMNQRINDVLWNEELGVYCHRLWAEDGTPGRFLTRLTPMNFYPLMCGAPGERRAARLLEILTDPHMFWGEWLIPTLAYNDPDWHEQDYWKGHTWAPVNYLIWEGIRRYGSAEHKRQLAERSVRLFMRNWIVRGTCNEAYMSSTGMGDRYPHYTWGALLCQIGLEYSYDATASGKPHYFYGQEQLPSMEFRNMPSGGRLYKLAFDGGKVTVTLEV